jgi:hypothetical protein
MQGIFVFPFSPWMPQNVGANLQIRPINHLTKMNRRSKVRNDLFDVTAHNQAPDLFGLLSQLGQPFMVFYDEIRFLFLG